MSARRFWAATLAMLFICGVVVAGCGSDNALVGGECATGYSACAEACVLLESDPSNCGACGHACGSGLACVVGVCGGDGGFDATMGDGASGDAASDAKLGDGANDGTLLDGTSDGPLGDGDAGDGSTTDGSSEACTPPYDTAAQCGGCGVTCGGGTPYCLSSDGTNYACAACLAPLKVCNGGCVDETSDPFNCGSCGHVCPSNLCSMSQCIGSTAGNIVYIGHDYDTTPTGGSQAGVLTNAVFIQRANPLRILSYEQYADPTSVAKVKAIIASESGHAVTYTVSTMAADIPNRLTVTDYDVLLIYDQASAPSGTLGSIGTSWNSAVTTFTRSGGTIITLDGAAGSVAEMPIFEANSGLLNVTSHTSIPNGTPVDIVAPSDVVGVGVVSPYGADTHSVDLTFTQPDAGAQVTVVVREPMSGAAVVLHRVVPTN